MLSFGACKHPVFACLGIVLSLTACGEDQERIEEEISATAVEVFRGVPVVPLSTELSRSGAGDAAQLELYTPLDRDSSAAWYRRTLIQNGWNIEGDVRTPDGAVTIHASRDGPPLWIILRVDEQRGGTVYNLIGALSATEADDEAGQGVAIP